MKSKRKELRKAVKKAKFFNYEVSNKEYTITIDGQWTIVREYTEGHLEMKMRYDDLDTALDVFIGHCDRADLQLACEIEAEVINAKYGWE